MNGLYLNDMKFISVEFFSYLNDYYMVTISVQIKYNIFFVFRMKLFKNYIDASSCQRIFDELFHNLPWKQRSDVKNGIEYLQPRLTAWYGDVSYSYSGLTHEPDEGVSTKIDKLFQNW